MTYLHPRWIVFLAALPCLIAAPNRSDRDAGNVPLTVSLTASTNVPVPVGTVVTWTAVANRTSPANLWFRFRVRDRGARQPACRGDVWNRRACWDAEFSVLRDYAPSNVLEWTAADHEGQYEIEVSVRDNDTHEVAAASQLSYFGNRVIGGAPVISETAMPLVAMYSAPPCPAGSTMRVEFWSAASFPQSTSPKPCNGSLTMNFYIAGMPQGTQYSLQHVIESGSQLSYGPVLVSTTATVPLPFGPYSVLQQPSRPVRDGILLHSRFGTPTATDWRGNVVWFYPGNISFLTRAEPGGFFLGWSQDQSDDPAHQALIEFDLAGITTRETNAARINEQLAAMGKHSITAFHHEARPLSNGNILALASTERILTDVQGAGPVDVLGDMILVLDQNLQVVWAWDAFDHLDPHRPATLSETCISAANGCSPFYLSSEVNDWLHGNSLQLTSDGDILYSVRHQDWIVKIDYRNGNGSGDIVWRLGKDGDFQFISDDPYPWFSHQHDANIDANGLLTVFDNGNVRFANDGNAHSRGQVLQIDEKNRTATLLLNADLGAFSMALGSAQKLDNGNYHFDLGFRVTDNTARAIELDPSGRTVYELDIGEPEYRSFRMRDLYTP